MPVLEKNLYFFIFALLFVIGLSILKFYTKKGFYIAQVVATFAFATHLQNSPTERLDSLFIIWILASLAALSITSVSKE
ncbi:MAG: hypothetical protein E7539_00485 [Ruminococcaceae bacterium]|nr:hypothetical protein [Oscillospiraceae bacterium]